MSCLAPLFGVSDVSAVFARITALMEFYILFLLHREYTLDVYRMASVVTEVSLINYGLYIIESLPISMMPRRQELRW